MEKFNMQTANIVDENIKKIAELFPNCLTEAKDDKGRLRMVIDFEKLKQELSEDAIGEGKERYQFTWPDKRHAIRLANTPISDTLRPCREESLNFDTTQNLYIEGDNLNVLKLLRENYLGKVKMIYIDPPYNTGGDFVYKDNFIMKNSDYKEMSGSYDEKGNVLVGELEKNTESNGRFHTDWLNMIYPRLKVAKDLLSEDGVIFISIDDNEQRNMKILCDEIFGERNFLTCVTRGTGTPTGGGFDGLVNELDYILIYARNILNATINGLEMSDTDALIYDQEDEYGKYLIRPLRRTGGEDRREDRPTMYYPITAPDGSHVYPKGPTGYDSRWICGESKYKELVANHLIYWKEVNQNGVKKWNVYQKFYLEGRLKAPGNLWTDVEGNKKATRDIRALFDSKKVFDFPKPVGVLQKCIGIGSDKESIIIDFFSGSATTAHAVMLQNVADGGSRKYIMVQFPEETTIETEAYQAGYKNICEIGKERIRRAGRQIRNGLESKCNALRDGIERMLSARPDATAQLLLLDQQKEIAQKIYEEQILPKQRELDELEERLEHLDIGFRVLKLDSSNMEDVYYRPEESTEKTLFEDNIKPDRTSEDLLFQVMLECNLPLSAKIETEKIAEKEVFSVNDGYLIACFDEKVNEDVIKEVAKRKPYYFVMRDSSLSSDNVADNFEQIFQAYSKDTIRRIL